MDAVNWDAAKFWLDVAQWAVTILIGVAMWVRTGRNLNRDAINQQAQRQDETERRLLRVEESLKYAPTHEDIASVREEISGIKANLSQNTAMVQRVHDYLLNKKD